MSNLNQHSFSSKPLPLVLSQQALLKSVSCGKQFLPADKKERE